MNMSHNFVADDPTGEQAALKRKMQLAEAMLAAGMQPGRGTEVVNGIAVKQSPLEGLSRVAQAFAGQYKLNNLEKERQAMGEKSAAEMKTGVQRFLDTMYGTPGGVPLPGEAAETEAIKADPRRAVVEALSSSHPALRTIGMAHMQELMKNKGADKLDLKTLAGMSTPESVLQNPMDPSKWVPKRELKGLNAGEVLVDAAGNVTQPGPGGTPGQAPGNVTPRSAPTSPGQHSGHGWETVTIGGDLYQKTATGLKKLDNAPKTTVNNHMSPGNVHVYGQKAGFEAWSKDASGTVKELSDSARQSVKLMTQLSQLEALTKGGTNAGPLADAQTFLQGLANQAGIKIDKNMLSNSQAFNSVATQAWAALMQQNGGARGLVKEESQKLADSLPALVQTPAGRAQIISVLRQQAEMNISDAKKANEEYGKALRAQDPALFTYGLANTQLPQSPPQPAAPGSVAPRQSKPSKSNW